MVYVLFVLPLADFKTVQAPVTEVIAGTPDTLLSTFTGMAIIAVAFGLLLVGLRLWGAVVRRPVTPAKPKNWILVDGSNVVHWQDNTPQLAPLLKVIKDLKARGFSPGVVFDANAGYKLFGKYLNERDLSRMLTLPQDQVLVAPKGTPADPYILDTARKFKAQVVTNDRYRDWAGTYPEVAEQDLLIWGGIKDGKLWLRYPDLAPASVRAKASALVE